MQYRIRLRVWSIEAPNIDEARKKAIALVKDNADTLVSVVPDEPKRGLLTRIIFG